MILMKGSPGGREQTAGARDAALEAARVAMGIRGVAAQPPPP